MTPMVMPRLMMRAVAFAAGTLLLVWTAAPGGSAAVLPWVSSTATAFQFSNGSRFVPHGEPRAHTAGLPFPARITRAGRLPGSNYIRLNGSQGVPPSLLPVYHSTFSPLFYNATQSAQELQVCRHKGGARGRAQR
jgi:hypothetical protein